MPLYRVAVHKRLTTAADAPEWVNTYHVNTASEEDAILLAQDIANVERAVHWNNVAFFKVSVRLASSLSSSGRQEAISGTGDRNVSDEHFLPRFCTVRCTFTDNINRPDQKYLRTPIAEQDQQDGILTPENVGFVITNYVDPLIAISGVVSSSGAPYTTGNTLPAVQMRQVDWHRRSRPGFKRGWVPV